MKAVGQRYEEIPIPPEVIAMQQRWNEINALIYEIVLWPLCRAQDDTAEAIARMEGEGGQPCCT